MRELTSPSWIKFKGFLFLLLGVFAVTLLLLLHPEWRVALLLGIAVWSFCRFYYFAFYVIEKYVDSSFRFAGLSSFVRYLMVQRRLPRSVARGESSASHSRRPD
jgi:hypothetical protein